mmetsp:Transcript_8605/g.28355  ORF Transcript_8605/g.28355 Transcript_8605/m.28355 type:complete len:238 (+) Transcript_8605:791-1504(+)
MAPRALQRSTSSSGRLRPLPSPACVPISPSVAWHSERKSRATLPWRRPRPLQGLACRREAPGRAFSPPRRRPQALPHPPATARLRVGTAQSRIPSRSSFRQRSTHPGSTRPHPPPGADAVQTSPPPHRPLHSLTASASPLQTSRCRRRRPTSRRRSRQACRRGEPEAECHGRSLERLLEHRAGMRRGPQGVLAADALGRRVHLCSSHWQWAAVVCNAEQPPRTTIIRGSTSHTRPLL